MSTLVTAIIEGKVYCNLASTIMYTFVDRQGAPVGTLGPMSTEARNCCKIYYRNKKVTVEQVEGGLPIVDGMEYYDMLPHTTEELRQFITGCQKRKKVDVIVVRPIVLNVYIAEGLSLEKLFSPVPQNADLHRFYAFGLKGYRKAILDTQEYVTHPHRYDVERVK